MPQAPLTAVTIRRREVQVAIVRIRRVEFQKRALVLLRLIVFALSMLFPSERSTHWTLRGNNKQEHLRRRRRSLSPEIPIDGPRDLAAARMQSVGLAPIDPVANWELD